MTAVDPEVAEQIRRENIRMHDRDSLVYDFRHPYMRDGKLQHRFAADIDELENLLQGRRPVSVLDCGAGTGNLTLKFLARGHQVTAVEISAGMLEVLQSKCPTGCRDLQTVEMDIDQYLAETDGGFDIVAFGATLHHLSDYLTTLKLACRTLKSGGLLYVTGEPTLVAQISRGEYRLLRLDEMLNVIYKMVHRPSHILSVLAKISGRTPVAKVDEALAEYHTDEGMDQQACIRVVESEGLDIQRFERFGLLGFRLTRWLACMLRLEMQSQFTLIARKG